MNDHSKHRHFAGFDWASDHHDIIVVDESGRIVADFQIAHTTAGWREWREKITAWPDLAVAVEISFGIVVENLLDSGVTVYPVNPKSAKCYRQRKCPSGTKTDSLDAWAMSRGGIMTLAWAVRNPDKVTAWAGIYPVCSLSSYPIHAELTSPLPQPFF